MKVSERKRRTSNLAVLHLDHGYSSHAPGSKNVKDLVFLENIFGLMAKDIIVDTIAHDGLRYGICLNSMETPQDAAVMCSQKHNACMERFRVIANSCC